MGFYDGRFGIGLTAHEKSDLVAYTADAMAREPTKIPLHLPGRVWQAVLEYRTAF